jgi:hypothetical protein
VWAARLHGIGRVRIIGLGFGDVRNDAIVRRAHHLLRAVVRRAGGRLRVLPLTLEGRG